MALKPLISALLSAAFAAPPAPADEVRALLAELVAVDTSDPPGHELPAAKVVEAYLAKNGIAAEILEPSPGRANLVARLPGGGARRPVIVMAHLDTVPARKEEWKSDPWKLTERDGMLYGRGAADDKGMAAAAAVALARLKREGAKLSRDVILVLEADEEEGSGVGIVWLLEHRPELKQAEFALNEGGSTVLSADRKKVMFVGLQSAEKVWRNVELKASGRGGHSSMPPPRTPLERLAGAVARLGALRFPPRWLPVTRAYADGLAPVLPGQQGELLRRIAKTDGPPPAELVEALSELDPGLAATLRTTCVPTIVNAGFKANVIPATVAATVNCRLLPGEDLAAFKARVKAAVNDPEVAIEIGDLPTDLPASPAGDNALFRAVEKAAAGLWPGAPVVPLLSTGGTDSKPLRRLGIAAYGIDPFPMTQGDGETQHAPDERLPAASLGPGAEFVHRILAELCR